MKYLSAPSKFSEHQFQDLSDKNNKGNKTFVTVARKTWITYPWSSHQFTFSVNKFVLQKKKKKRYILLVTLSCWSQKQDKWLYYFYVLNNVNYSKVKLIVDEAFIKTISHIKSYCFKILKTIKRGNRYC